MTELAQAGDPTSIDVLATIGRRLGVALSGLANIFDPDVIVIGGGVMAAGDLLLGPAREEFAARALTPQNETPIRAAALGPDAGMIGAAILARDELAAHRGGGLMAGRLIVCPTPIGNIGDVSPRLKQALADADLVACEDTRRAGRLYERLDLDPPRLRLQPRLQRGEPRSAARQGDRARGEGRAAQRRRAPRSSPIPATG